MTIIEQIRLRLLSRGKLIAELEEMRMARDTEVAAHNVSRAIRDKAVEDCLKAQKERDDARLEMYRISAIHDLARSTLGAPPSAGLVEHCTDVMRAVRREAPVEILRMLMGTKPFDVLKELPEMDEEARRVYVADAAMILDRRVFHDVVEEVFREQASEATLRAKDFDAVAACRNQIEGAALVESKLQTLAGEHADNIRRANEPKPEPGEIMPST